MNLFADVWALLNNLQNLQEQVLFQMTKMATVRSKKNLRYVKPSQVNRQNTLKDIEMSHMQST